MIEGAIIALVAAAIGWVARGARKTGGSMPPVRPICSCGDPRGKHIDGKGTCQAEHKQSTNGVQEFRRCGCQLYDGPEPMPEYYAPEIEG